MAPITTSIQIATGTDDAGYQPISGYNATSSALVAGSHPATDYRAWIGFRFLMPNINPDHITSVHLRLVGNNSVATDLRTRVEQAPAAAWANTGSNRPDTRWTAVGSTGEVATTFTNAAGTVTNIDITTRAKSAMASLTPNTHYLGVIVGPNTAAGVAQSQFRMSEYNVAPTPELSRPQLVIVYDPPPQDGAVTTIAPQVGFASGSPTTLTYSRVEYSYHDGIGDSTRRVLDLYKPMTPTPAGGWPVIFFVHGGAFNAGDEDDLSSQERFLKDSFDSGFAVISVSYKLTDFGDNVLFNQNIGWTRPHPIQDVMAAAKWVKTNEAEHNLNSDLLVGVGYSAGGHLLLESALLIEDPNRDSYQATYRGTSSALGSRYEDYPVLDFSEGRLATDFPVFKGVFSFAGPVSLSITAEYNPIVVPILNLYFGGLPNSTYVNATASREGDLNYYITGATGTIYASRTPAPPNFPIAINYTTTDTTVVPAASYGALKDALDTVGGYDTSSANGVVAEGLALSRNSYSDTYWGAGGHDGMFHTYPSSFYKGWLEEVKSQNAAPTNWTLSHYDGVAEEPITLSYYDGTDEISVTIEEA